MIGLPENSAQRNIHPTPITQLASCSIMAFACPFLFHFFYCELLVTEVTKCKKNCQTIGHRRSPKSRLLRRPAYLHIFWEDFGFGEFYEMPMSRINGKRPSRCGQLCPICSRCNS